MISISTHVRTQRRTTQLLTCLLVLLVSLVSNPWFLVADGDGQYRGALSQWAWLLASMFAIFATFVAARVLVRSGSDTPLAYDAPTLRRLMDGDRFRALVEDGAHCTLVCDASGAITYASPTLEHLLGFLPAQMLGKSLKELFQTREALDWDTLLVSAGDNPLPVLYQLRHADGSWRWIEMRLRDLSGVPAVAGMVLHCLDVSEREQAIAQRHAAEQRLQIALDASQVALWDLHLPTNTVRLSSQWAALVGGPPGERVMGLDQLWTSAHPEDMARLRDALTQTVMGSGPMTRVEHRFLTANGNWHWIESVGRVVERDGNGRALRLAGVNISIDSHKKVEATMAKLVSHDSLTGLPNRQVLLKRVSSAIERSSSSKQPLALMQVDVLHLRQINQSLGRETGDGLLRAIATRLAGCMHQGHTLAHIGSDEFAVSMPDIGDAKRAAIDAQALIACLADPFVVGGNELRIGANVGIAMFPLDAADAVGLLRCAEAAIAHSRSALQGEAFFFDVGMEQRTRRRQSLERRLRAAIEEGRLALAYQPIVCLRNGVTVGAEALVRWTDSEHGVVSPDELIPIAEEVGLIGALGEWVLRQSCIAAARWQSTITPDFRIAVNLSARQLAQPNLVEVVRDIIRESGIRQGTLELEITEHHQLFENWEGLKILQRLKHELGVRLVIDDFGTGYSGLRSLRLLPLDKLKIDRSFVHSAVGNSADAALLSGIVAIALDLALEITAEGVENDTQLACVRRLGCDTAQGYLTGKPLPASVFTRHLSESVLGAI